LDDRDITPLAQLVAAREVGGLLIGAFDGSAMIGFVYGFIGVEHGRTIHHSHQLAVKPEYRHSNLGYRLKLAQRERVLAQGITRITWTFDPLQSLNAYLNFRKLGVLGDAYKINFYGTDASSFLHRFGTDRLWLTWVLGSRRVRERLQGKPEVHQTGVEESPLIQVERDGSPRQMDLAEGLSGKRALIQIPPDINALQRQHPEQAMKWREATRHAFTEALRRGFLVEDFLRQPRADQPAGVYLLNRGRKMEDFA